MSNPNNKSPNKNKNEDINSKKTTLDDFKILRCIGEGAFGEVYLVKNYFNNKHYALKSIDKVFLAKQKKEHHVYNEKVILQHINNELVVKLQATFQDEKKLYFLMENVPNGELAKYLRQKSKLIREITIRGSGFLYSRNGKHFRIYSWYGGNS